MWSLKKQAIFFSILSDLLSAGFSLRQSLISIQNIMPEFYSVSHKVKKNLLMGTKISDALKENISKSTYYQLLIAEQHGEMEKSIKQLGSLLERRVEQQNKLKSLMVYPMILFLGTIYQFTQRTHKNTEN
nr:type II secretion system F family protein [Ligilactobacillus salivarius]